MKSDENLNRKVILKISISQIYDKEPKMCKAFYAITQKIISMFLIMSSNHVSNDPWLKQATSPQ